MSFNATKKRAQDKDRNLNSRRVSVRSCIQLCLYYSGLNGYQSIVGYYNSNNNLNSDNLNSETIDKILFELTNLREQSKQLRKDYYDYRKKQKKLGQRAISKKEESIWRENWKKINQLWDKFDSEENRKMKALVFEKEKRR